MTLPQSVVFVCPGRYSVGELYNALILARQLEDVGISTTFIVTEPLAEYARASGASVVVRSMRRGRGQEVRADIESASADLVIVADYHLLFLEPGTVELRELLPRSVPIAFLDSLGFAAGVEVSNALAQLPGAAVLHRWFREMTSIPAADPEHALLRPVPVASATALNSFALYPRDPSVRDPSVRATRESVREKYGVGTDQKLVVVAQSAWAATGFTQLGRSRGRQLPSSYDALRLRWLVHVLERVGVPIVVVGVRKEAAALATGPSVQFVHTSFLGLDDFSDLLGAADLYLTDNLLSAAMGRAASLGTPCLAFVHETAGVTPATDGFEKAWQEEMHQSFPGWDFPYLVNPFGWIAEVCRMAVDNAYLASIPRVDAFDSASMAAAVRRQLGSRPDRAPTKVIRALAYDVADGATLVCSLFPPHNSTRAAQPQ